MWDGLAGYWTHVDFPVFQLDVAPSHDGVVFSWEHLGVGVSARECGQELVTISIDASQTLKFCGQTTPPPRVFKCRFLNILYSSVDIKFQRIKNTGFSLRFSLHNDSALPQQLPDQKTWNCSVPHWADFQEHFACNLLTECAGGEDEAACPYSPLHGTCPPGYWSAGGSCFSFEPTPRHETSWEEAEAACESRGDRLPSLNTRDKWRAVMDLLRYRRWQNVYVGLRSARSRLPYLYNNINSHWLWSDETVAYYMRGEIVSRCKPCAFFRVYGDPGTLYLDKCQEKVPGNIMCERPPSLPGGNVHYGGGDNEYAQINTTRCPDGHVTHNFLSCDLLSHCLTGCYDSLSLPLTSVPPSFQCHNKLQRVAFTLVCDHRPDCSDGSDEICVFPHSSYCQGFACKNKQCIPESQWCDHHQDCSDNTDESISTCYLQSEVNFIDKTMRLPAKVELHNSGPILFKIFANTSQPETAGTGSDCPGSHFQCPGISYYCLPVYVRCNGVYDCPGRQDEAGCDNFRCPGFFRCRGSYVCVDSSNVCDTVIDCPLGDDEVMCGFVCPDGCTCYGMAFFCTAPFHASDHAGLRFLDARESGMGLEALVSNTMLFYLNLAECKITQLQTMRFVNVYHLDLSKNYITTLEENHISSCENLQWLILAENPITSMLQDRSSSTNTSLPLLDFLDLSSVPINVTSFETFRIFRKVSYLNLSNTGIDALSAFRVFSRLRVLDLSGCPVTNFTRFVFQGLDDLSTVYVDNYKLCCPETLPDGFNVLNCHAPFDEVSSCEDLLKSGLYRVSLSVLTSLILVGNTGSFVYRVVINRSKRQTSFGLFMANLCVSDFLMGLYSAIVCVADRLYLGNYHRNDVTWRRSVTCKTAGFLSLVSNEVSLLIICIITVDRFLVLRFPCSRQFHFSLRSARLTCVVAWSVGILLAVTPLLPVTSHWRFYGQTGMCIPLLVTRTWFDGREYSLGVFVYLNCALFLVIAVGQLVIYVTVSVSANSMAPSDTTDRAKDHFVAQRFITVALSDFLCWFPVGLLGILSARGHSVPRETSIVIAVFVLPLNSALNPFLYTVNVIREQRRRAREQRLLKMLLARHDRSTVKREGVQNT